MRNLEELNEYRQLTFREMSIIPQDKKENGDFLIPYKTGNLLVQASLMFDWEQVSVIALDKESNAERIPSPEEMAEVVRLFFRENEPVIEIHPKSCDYVNINPSTLHVWRHAKIDLPIPPKVNGFEEFDIVDLPKSNLALLISSATQDGWDAYDVRVLKKSKPLRRKPSWNEMCVARKAICGENTVAFQYHSIGEDDGSGYETRLWIPPCGLEFPTPEPYLVGIRDEKDEEVFEKRLHLEVLKKITKVGLR